MAATNDFVNTEISVQGPRIIVGRSNVLLGKEIARLVGIPAVSLVINDFANGEVNIAIEESVRGCDVFIVQTGCSNPSKGKSINDYILELFAIIDACTRASTKSITVIMPFFAYSRSDKKDAPRVPIMASVMVNTICNMKVDRIMTMDLHSGQITGYAHTTPFDNLFATKLFIDYLENVVFDGMSKEEINEKYIIISPDVGAMKRTDDYAKRLGMNIAMFHKQRDYSQTNVVKKSMLVGTPEEIAGKTAIIIDDMIDTMGTMCAAINELVQFGIKDVIVVATHGIFSGPALERMANCEHIVKVIVTDTIPQTLNMQKESRIECIPCAPLFAQAIDIIVNGGSISSLFV